MTTKIDNLDIISYSFQNPKKEDERKEKKLELSEELPSVETSQIIDSSEIDQSCPFSPYERKISHDSTSICGSQVETLSQTSESSFFISYTSHNSQMTSSNDMTQIGENRDSFFAGVEEYFQKIMPEKFKSYTNTRNYLHKSTFLKKKVSKINKTGTGVDNYANNTIMNNYFYYPIMYCPINAFYLNNIPNFININNNSNNNFQNQKEKNKKISNSTKSNEKEINNVEQKLKKEDKDNKKDECEYEDKDKAIKEDNNAQKENEKGEDEINPEINVIKTQERHQNYYNYRNNYNSNNNRSKWQDHNYRRNNYKSNYNNSKAYVQNYNRKYNNFVNNYYSNNYYDINQDVQGERTRFYNNNYHQKRRYQKPYENKFSKYK